MKDFKELQFIPCRHVVLPRELAKQVPKSHLMSEDEWRRLGVQQSLGWVHYMIHEPGETFLKDGITNLYCTVNCLLTYISLSNFFFPEPHILLFRRPLPKLWWQAEKCCSWNSCVLNTGIQWILATHPLNASCAHAVFSQLKSSVSSQVVAVALL